MLIALLLQVAIPPGLQQPPATMVVEPVAMLLATFDADGDGRTTRAELDAGVKRTFAAIDTAGTGKLGYIGYSDWAERWLGDRNALPSPFEIDSDGDNQITEAELDAQLRRTFDRLDRNKDGVLTRAELLTIRASTGGRDPSDRSKKRGGPPPQ